MTPVEDVATTIAEKVRANGWDVRVDCDSIDIYESSAKYGLPICTLWCEDASQAKRLAEMMVRA